MYYIEQQDEEGRVTLKKELLEWPEHIIEQDVVIETKVSSATMSKLLRKQEISALVERMQQIIGEQMKLAQAATDINNPASAIAWQLLNQYQEAVNRMMIEFDLVEKEKLNAPLLNVQQFIQPFQQEIGNLRNENQTLQQQLQAVQGQLSTILGAVGGGPRVPQQAGPVQRMG